MSKVAVRHMTGGDFSFLPLQKLKDTVLGRDYELSVVIIGDARSQELNRRYRRKNKPANILSFPLSKTDGEIFLNPRQAQREVTLFDMPYRRFLVYLLIHGLLHLKGLRHGSTMNQAEKKFLRRFLVK